MVEMAKTAILKVLGRYLINQSNQITKQHLISTDSNFQLGPDTVQVWLAEPFKHVTSYVDYYKTAWGQLIIEYWTTEGLLKLVVICWEYHSTKYIQTW